MLEIGSIVAGKLRIERFLGKGGMGLVAVATHLQLDQQVAIKVLHDELASDREVVERLIREARASSKLKSEHVCRVSDVGQLETGAPYIVMELLEGDDLAHVIAEHPLPIPTAVDYVLQACVAVAEAHSVGIVHRDLKPANLFLTRKIDGSALVKVLDFGIAKAQSASDFKLTRTQAVMGSPGYMSPEALRAASDADARSDIWAMGVILYEAVSGRLPFEATTITELAVKVVVDPPAPLDTDPRYAAIVMRCLEKQPEARYQTVGELAAALAPLGSDAAQASATLILRLSGMQGAAPAKSSASLSMPHATTLQAAAGQSQIQAPKKKKRGLAIVAGLVVAAGAAAGAALALRGGGDDKPVARDAAVVAHAPAIDAMPTPDAADTHADVRDKLARLAAAHDYYALLQIADLDKGDPQADAIVADAKQQYIAQQMRVIDAEIHDGQCAKARDVAAAANQVVTDDATLAAKAKTCTAKPTHVDPPTTSLSSEATAAQDAYTRGDNATALADAEKVLAKQPDDAAMLRIAAATACSLKEADKAKKYAAKLPPHEKDFAAFVCKQNGVSLEKPANAGSNAGSGSASEPTPQNPYDEPADLAQVEDAMKHNDFNRVLREADKVLKTDHNNLVALTAAGIASCELKHKPRARFLIKRLPPSHQGPVRQACQKQGIPLD